MFCFLRVLEAKDAADEVKMEVEEQNVATTENTYVGLWDRRGLRVGKIVNVIGNKNKFVRN